MDRKTFIRQCGTLCLGAAALSALQRCVPASYYAQSNRKGRQLAVRRSEFMETANGKLRERLYVLVKTEELAFPICIYRLGPDRYSALLMECTHRSCELHAGSAFLVCPCHGSEFTRLGEVQNPPAEQNLHAFTITYDEQTLYIHL